MTVPAGRTVLKNLYTSNHANVACCGKLGRLGVRKGVVPLFNAVCDEVIDVEVFVNCVLDDL